MNLGGLGFPCPVCDGEPEECARIGHVWVTCRECGEDMRPSYGGCFDCGATLPPVLPGVINHDTVPDVP